MKTTIKIVSILMIAMMLIMTTTPVFAGEATSTLNATKPKESEVSELKTLAGKILGFLQWAAGIIAVLIIAILGIKYMMGSLEEKAEYKKSFVPLVVGIIVVFGAITIANLLVNTFNS